MYIVSTIVFAYRKGALMTSKELLYVKTIVDEKSISKAARKLYMAQPSLSQSIQRLEDSLGTALFKRTSHGLLLTYAGERYYQMAAQILKIYEDFESEVSDINNLKTGRIHIGTTNHLGALILPEVLPAFRRACPHIEVHVHEDNSSLLEQKLQTGELDFAIMHAPKDQEPEQINYDFLAKDPFLVVMSQEHALTGQAEVKDGYPYPVLDLKLLSDVPLIMLHKQQRIRQVMDNALKKAGILRPNIALTLRNYETAQLLAAAGIGITCIPAQYSGLSYSGYEPARFSIDETYDASWDLCIATSNNAFLSKADQLFIRMIKEKEQYSDGNFPV